MEDGTRWIEILLALAVTVSVSGPLSAGNEEQAPRPFDPLSEDEEKQAIEIALANQTTEAQLSPDHVVIGAALHTEKSMREEANPRRAADVSVYDHEIDRTLQLLVDLDAGEVLRLETTDIQPPLTAGEIHASGQIALSNQTVQDRLQAAGYDPGSVEWTARLWTGPGPSTCPVERCALVAFLDGERYHHEGFPLVDLGGQHVQAWIEAPISPEDPSRGDEVSP